MAIHLVFAPGELERLTTAMRAGLCDAGPSLVIDAARSWCTFPPTTKAFPLGNLSIAFDPATTKLSDDGREMVVPFAAVTLRIGPVEEKQP